MSTSDRKTFATFGRRLLYLVVTFAANPVSKGPAELAILSTKEPISRRKPGGLRREFLWRELEKMGKAGKPNIVCERGVPSGLTGGDLWHIALARTIYRLSHFNRVHIFPA